MSHTILDLPDDILYKIFPYCSYDGLVHLQLVCQQLHTVVSESRDAWVSVIVNAPIGVAPQTTPHRHLSDYSTAELKVLAVQAYKRRKNLYHPSKISPSDTFRITPANGKATYFDQARLIPGGLHLMVLRTGEFYGSVSTLELYDLVKEERTWHVVIEGSQKGVADFDLEYGSEIVLNVAVSLSTTGTAQRENSIIVFRLNMISMTHTKIEYQSDLRSIGFDAPSIVGDRVSIGLGLDYGMYILNWASGEDVIVFAEKDVKVLTGKLVRETLLYCSLFEGSSSHTFHHISLSNLGQYCSRGRTREGVEAFILPKTTPNELVLTHFLESFWSLTFSVIPPSWETGYFTKVAISGTPTDQLQPYTLYLLTSIAPQRSPSGQVGPFQVTGIVDVKFPAIVCDSSFWFTRMSTLVAVKYNDIIRPPHTLYAVRFHGDFREGGLGTPVSQILEVNASRVGTQGRWHVDEYSGAVVFIEEDKFKVLHFN